MFPHLSSNHWCLAAVDVAYHKIILHDSLTNNYVHCMDIIEDYLVVEAAERKCTLKTWSKEICREAPQQNNFNDYGVYVCMNSRNLVEKSNYNVSTI